jgi:hypothetical protein
MIPTSGAIPIVELSLNRPFTDPAIYVLTYNNKTVK